MKKFMVALIILLFFNCENNIQDKNLKSLNKDNISNMSGEKYKTYDKNLIYDEWILEKSYQNYLEMVEKYGAIEGNYDFVVIKPSKKFKKINNEIAYLYNVNMQWDIRIIDIICKFPKYRIKFKYNETETIDSKGNFIAEWLDGEIDMHFNSEDEVWFELVYFEKGKEKEPSDLYNIIKYGKDNIYKRKKILKVGD